MSKVLLSIDAGKRNLKVIGKEVGTDKVNKISFPSKYNITDDKNEEYEGNSHMITLENKSYVVGDAGSKYDVDSNKIKLIHKLCAYTAITEFIEAGTTDNDIYIVLACPIDFIDKKIKKEEYKKFIANEGNEVNTVVDGKKYTFTVKDIIIKQEGSGVLFKNTEKFLNKEVAVIDLGGVNFSFCIYNNCVPVKESRFAMDFGGNYLSTIALKELRVATSGKSITESKALESLIEGVLTLGSGKMTDSIDTISKIKTDYLMTIVDEIKKRSHDLDVIQPIFCGGTTSLIKETIANKIPHAIVVNNPKWESPEGLFVIANAKYDK